MQITECRLWRIARGLFCSKLGPLRAGRMDSSRSRAVVHSDSGETPEETFPQSHERILAHPAQHSLNSRGRGPKNVRLHSIITLNSIFAGIYSHLPANAESRGRLVAWPRICGEHSRINTTINTTVKYGPGQLPNETATHCFGRLQGICCLRKMRCPARGRFELGEVPKSHELSLSLCHLCDCLFERSLLLVCLLSHMVSRRSGYDCPQHFDFTASMARRRSLCYGCPQSVFFFFNWSFALQQTDQRLEPASTRNGFAPRESFWHSCSPRTFPSRRSHMDRLGGRNCGCNLHGVALHFCATISLQMQLAAVVCTSADCSIGCIRHDTAEQTEKLNMEFRDSSCAIFKVERF